MASTAGAIRAGRAFVEIFADSTQLNKGLKKARGEMVRFAASVKGIGSSIAGGFTKAQQAISSLGNSLISIGTQMAAIGVLGALGIKKSVDEFVAFDSQMLITQGILGSTGQDMDKLRDRALELGKTTSFTATEVASGMTELARAGRDAAQIYSDVAAAMNIARGTMIDLGKASQILVNTQNQFGLLADEADRVADSLVAAVSSSSQNIEDMGYAMKFVAPIANELGISLEETATAIGLLADAGLRGTVGGTQLARVLKELFQPNKRDLLEDMGLTLESEGRFVGFISLFEQLQEVTKNMSSGERVGFFQTMFGRGGNVAGIMTDNIQKFGELEEKILSMRGIAERLRKTMESQLGGAFLKATSAISNMAIEIGQSLAPALSKIAGVITDVFRKLSDWIKLNRDVVVSIAKSVAQWVALSVSILGLGFALRAVGSAMAGFGQLVKLAFMPAVLAIEFFIGLMKVALPAALSIANTAFVAMSAGIQATGLAVNILLSTMSLARKGVMLFASAIFGFAEFLFVSAGPIAGLMALADAFLIVIAGGLVLKLAIQGVASGIKNFSTSVMDSVKNVTDAFGVFFRTVSGGFADLTVTKGFAALKTDAIEAYNAITLAVTSGNLEDAWRIALNGVKTLFNDAMSYLEQNGFVKLFDSMVAAAKFAFGAMVIEVKSAFSKMLDGAASFINPVVAGIKEIIALTQYYAGAAKAAVTTLDPAAARRQLQKEFDEGAAERQRPVIDTGALKTEKEFDRQRRALAAKHNRELFEAAGKRYDNEIKRQIELGRLRDEQEKQVGVLRDKIDRKATAAAAEEAAKSKANAAEEERVRAQNEREGLIKGLKEKLQASSRKATGSFSAIESRQSLFGKDSTANIVSQLETLNETNEKQLRAINGLGTLTVGAS